VALARSWRPSRFMTSGAVDEVQSGKSQSRLRSREGWKEKSNPATVLITCSRALRNAALMRRFSRGVSSSASRSSMASIPSI
jgi:hypothetical protein